MVRLLYLDGEYTMQLVRGTATQPRAWSECGWEEPAPQLPSVEIRPEGGVRAFADNVGSQHTVICYGDCTERMRHLCKLLGIRVL